MWDVKGHLLSDQPFKSHQSHANIICCMLSTRYWVMMGDFHKTVLTFIFLLTLSACCTTDCHYRHTLSSSTSSPQEYTVFQVAAGLSVSVCVCTVFTHELMYGYYWCVKAAGMLTCVRYDMSCMP